MPGEVPGRAVGGVDPGDGAFLVVADGEGCGRFRDTVQEAPVEGGQARVLGKVGEIWADDRGGCGRQARPGRGDGQVQGRAAGGPWPVSSCPPLTACRCTDGTLSPATTTTASASWSNWIAWSRLTVAV